MIFSVLAWAQAVETNGADNAGAKPAAPAMALDVFRNSRRVTERFRLCPPDVIVDLLAGAFGDFVDSTPEGWRPIPGTGVGGRAARLDRRRFSPMGDGLPYEMPERPPASAKHLGRVDAAGLVAHVRAPLCRR